MKPGAMFNPMRRAALAAVTSVLALAGCDGNVNDKTIGLAVTIRVSVGSAGGQGNQGSTALAMSADGRYIAFSSDASNLVPGDTNGATDVFLYDTLTGTTTLVSEAMGGGPGNGASLKASISADGSRIAFESDASDLVALDTNVARDIFVRDLTPPASTVRASLADGGFESIPFGFEFGASDASISADGAYVAFVSDHTDLVIPTVFMFNFLPNVFRHELATLTTELVSITAGGGESLGISTRPAISADGQFVAFESSSDDLIAGDTNLTSDVYVRDMLGGVTERVSVDSAGAEANNFSLAPSISPDGSVIAFVSQASNLAPDTTPNSRDIFVRDRIAPSTILISRNSQGLQGAGDSDLPFLSAGGRFVSFVSGASNLVAGDTNGVPDVFRHDLTTGDTVRVSVATYGVAANNSSGNMAVSPLTADGRFVAFHSTGFNLVPGDTNGVDDVFLRGPLP